TGSLLGTRRLDDGLDGRSPGHADRVAAADVVIVGSDVPEGIEVGRWVLATARGLAAFYDIDTPVSPAALGRMSCDYLAADQIEKYDFYLSFSGGRSLELLEQRYHSPMAVPLYCSFDPERYFPEPRDADCDLGYMGTYSDRSEEHTSELQSRENLVCRLLLE